MKQRYSMEGKTDRFYRRTTRTAVAIYVAVFCILIAIMLSGCKSATVVEKLAVPQALTVIPERPEIEAHADEIQVALYIIDMEKFSDKLILRLRTIAKYYGEGNSE